MESPVAASTESAQIPKQSESGHPNGTPSSDVTPQVTVVSEATAPQPEPQADKAAIRALSQTFGHIPDVPIFSSWAKRIYCSNSAVHRSILAGICGNGRTGAFSVALSGGYEDDLDGGDIVIYTGAGGKKKWSDDIPPKRLRNMNGPQVMDQSWEDTPNMALLTSCDTGLPVRVIRSSKCQSKYAPVDGYRYDGLYTVAACWTANGINGHKTCRCRLERVPGQPPLPVRPPTITASSKKRGRRSLCQPTASASWQTDTLNLTNPDVNFHQFLVNPPQVPAQPSESTARNPQVGPQLQQEYIASETSTSTDFIMGVQDESSSLGQHEILTSPPVASGPVPDDSMNVSDNVGTVGEGVTGDVRRGEDDVLLVPSENGQDGRIDVTASKPEEQAEGVEMFLTSEF